LFKWYNGNPFDAREETADKAITVLRWCQENSGIFQYPASMRRSIMNDASVSFDVSLKHLTDLMVDSATVLHPSSTTRLIAFEGIDGSGKTHQMTLLREFLVGQQADVTVLSYPDYHEFFGRELASLLSGNGTVRADHIDPKSMALWYALDRKSSASQICAERANGFALLNRYTLSSVVYQSVRSNVDLADWIFQLEHTHLAIPAPDLYIVFDVSPVVSQANVSDRRRKDGTLPGLDVYEQSMDLLTAARERYRALADRLPGIELIECMVDDKRMKPPDQIHAEVVSCLHRHRLLPTIPSQMNFQK
jgi:dTMP kinase